MARSSARSEKPGPARIPADPVLLAADLQAWAGPGIASSGRKEALLGRVEMLRLAADGRSIEARVRGNRPLPYLVTVQVSGEALQAECTCARATRPACKHAIAALEALRFPLSPGPRETGGAARRRRGSGLRGQGRIVQHGPSRPGFLVLGGPERALTRDERVGAAREEELLARRQRSRKARADVEPLDADGGPPRFRVEGREPGAPFVVTLRGPKAREGCCPCADYAENELRTCLHVERAKAWYSRKKKRIPDDLVFVYWSPRAWTDQVPDPVREIRVDWPAAGDRPRELEPFWDDQGRMRAASDGRPAQLWAGEALEALHGAAERAGWRWLLSPEVEHRVETARQESELISRLAGIDPAGSCWTGIVENLGFRLHPYQEAGALFLARKGRALLADEMGLGKTVQAIVAALLLRHSAGARKALVVCPASIKHQWRREIIKACGEQAVVVDAARSQRLAQYESWAEGFLILNYELVLRDLAEIREAGADLVILDEAQRIKNWDTKTARAVKQLESRFAFILTGTPLENRLLELHSLVEFLHPRALGPRWRLLPFHAVTEAPGRVIAYEGLEVLRRRMRGFFLRRDREGVLDQLPERTENTFWTGMTQMQNKPYRRHASTVASILSRNQALLPGEIRVLLQCLTSMRILCNAHAQYDWDNAAERLKLPEPPTRGEIKALGSPKLEEFARVLEDLLEESETKIVVFSQWGRMLRLAHFVVRDLLDRRDLRGELFHGGLNSRAREELLDAFRDDPEFRVMFSTDAGGLGLNLQESASIVVNLEVPWNPAVLEQRIGRVHRMGQRRSVQVLHFVARGAIEERVRQVVESKRALFDGLLSDDVDRIVFDERSHSSFLQRVRGLVGDSDARP